MSLLERVKRLEGMHPELTPIQLCDIWRHMIAALDAGETFSELSARVNENLLYSAGVTPQGWEEHRLEAIADYEKIFGPGSFKENRDSQKRWREASEDRHF
ncbi:hypothetical protein E4633_06530 [Geomonas terrae]|uniref:Uncharacterized protein n=1 Tax=Geomonas terrae TaxID=2562681 RepID=A0A4S1CMU1_9BACT|nr:hypothetical protein [Geomonas terrae]TGU75104.1 hypothetical protein E4633_06530 [Geomonas terrae]